MKISYNRNLYGDEYRLWVGNTVYMLNKHGQIGDETSNQDLWRAGYRIGFTRISRYLKPLGLYLFKATP